MNLDSLGGVVSLEYSEGGRRMCSWIGSTLAAEDALHGALRMRLAAELATLGPAIAQIEAGDPAGALKMLQRRATILSTPVAT